MPAEPPPTIWEFPPPERFHPDDDLVATGADLEPGTVLAAYRRGLFPMPVGGRRAPMAWFSPVRRGVLRPRGLHVSRSLARSRRRFEIRLDTACAEVIDACADPRRPSGWIDGRIRAAYLRLHALGWVHSVETWRAGRLVGGLYGVAIGGLFAGESMFHHETDASKVALLGLVEVLDDGGRDRLVDTQWLTPHLASLGATETSREEYLALLPGLLEAPPQASWPAGLA
ncbi:MAG TPA: leucyl/phenylalanyl-tRNA--protein transferase [Nocardioides sp.]|uniref:leucyl/phenylalanyl-tRNA--protein transferase n=1 Tax=Nocardioides sp. TaxID=35761 RepID=UPI002E369579|nr:leucyl/phenylalanyl-tRNA--protein transferase [Nocardioides sp.]HEX3932215.1 leucyl/phenylalanyl-tRNA--protein transferase [Nocardioides sp.]